MIIVTGGAGFIGSCIAVSLNKRGLNDLVIVDHLDEGDPKQSNLDQITYKEYFDKKEFLQMVIEGTLQEKVGGPIEAIIHMGACSSTTLQDAEYFQENNFEYTCKLAKWALDNNVRFIYASSAATYGDGNLGYSDSDELTPKLKPLNLYGESKQKFDQWVLDNKLENKIVGLKFFNVFGPNEYHKGDMRSVIAKAYQRVATEGKMALFKSYHEEYADGEQRRDFIYVLDAVDVVFFFLDNKNVNGIFNVGTGQSRSWNDLANALFSAVNKEVNIEYIEMPEELKARYQYFTEADMSKLREHGYTGKFTSLEDAVADYAQYLKDHQFLTVKHTV